MTHEEYWDRTPYLTVIYRNVDLQRRKEKNEYMWLQGMYFYDAITIAMANSFRKKGQKAIPYLQKPYRITPPTEAEKKAAAEAERQKAIKSLTAWKDAWDKHNGR